MNLYQRSRKATRGLVGRFTRSGQTLSSHTSTCLALAAWYTDENDCPVWYTECAAASPHTAASTLLPWPGADETSSSPPTERARSRIETSPNPPPGQPDARRQVRPQPHPVALRDLGHRVGQRRLERLAPGRRQGADRPAGLQPGPLHRTAQPGQVILACRTPQRIQVPRQVGKLLRQPVVQVARDPLPLLDHRRPRQRMPVRPDLPHRPNEQNE